MSLEMEKTLIEPASANITYILQIVRNCFSVLSSNPLVTPWIFLTNPVKCSVLTVPLTIYYRQIPLANFLCSLMSGVFCRLRKHGSSFLHSAATGHAVHWDFPAVYTLSSTPGSAASKLSHPVMIQASACLACMQALRYSFCFVDWLTDYHAMIDDCG